MKTTAADPGEPSELHLVRNHGRPRIALANLRLVVCRLLAHLNLQRYRLGIHLVSARRITRLNEEFLLHAGVTDVIAFDYRSDTPELDLHGEIFVCVSETLKQAKRYRATEPEELVRTIVHGILHLRGYEDGSVAKRRHMRAAENRWLKTLKSELPLQSLLPEDR
jgi:rRNA maturation RNase YbeY